LDKTVVAKALTQCDFTFNGFDYTANDKKRWEQVKLCLAKYQQDFVIESFEHLYDIRCVESDKKNVEITNPDHLRYFYIASLRG